MKKVKEATQPKKAKKAKGGEPEKKAISEVATTSQTIQSTVW